MRVVAVASALRMHFRNRIFNEKRVCVCGSAAVARQFGNWNGGGPSGSGSQRRGRMSSMHTLPPALTQSMLMQAYNDANEEVDVHGGGRHGE